jgi:hypothetical protein
MAFTKIERETRDHPERFENDIPPMKSGPAWDAYNREMDKRMPAWAKALKAEQQGTR